MSAIFGVHTPGMSTIDPGELDAMARAISYWGTGTPTWWSTADIALGCVGAGSETTPAPLHHVPTGVRLASSSRLDNRAEIIRKLGLEPKSECELPDSKLILESYLRYGEACVELLLGDWTFALWDPREGKLILARDPIGMSPLYYHASSQAVWFSTSIKGLLAVSRIPKAPNLLAVAQILATWPTNGIRTAYEGLTKLPSGHVLIAQEGSHEVRRYWQAESVQPLNLRSDQEYIEAFLEIYSEAVRCRFRSSGNVGVTLSGGLDSGSVAALAAREMRLSGQTLQAFSSVPAYSYPTPPGRFSDESALIEANREMFGNLMVHYVRAEDLSPLDGIDRTLDLLNEPIHGASNAYWLIGLLRCAKEFGIETLLTGQMGNFTVSWGGDRFASPLQRAKLWLLISWAKPLRNQARRLMNRGQDAWLAHSPLSLQFAKKMEIDRLRREDGHDPNFAAPTHPHRLRLSNIQKNLRVTGAYMNEMGAGYGVRTSDPTSDKRIVEFCLATPVEVFQREGMDRRLVRRAMEGLLPDAVRLNRTKGWQASDLAQRIIRSAPEIESALEQMENNPLSAEVLNLPKMRRVFTAVQHTPDLSNTYAAGTILMRGLNAGRFLNRF